MEYVTKDQVGSLKHVEEIFLFTQLIITKIELEMRGGKMAKRVKVLFSSGPQNSSR